LAGLYELSDGPLGAFPWLAFGIFIFLVFDVPFLASESASAGVFTALPLSPGMADVLSPLLVAARAAGICRQVAKAPIRNNFHITDTFILISLKS
jgi:hypothetical protein